MTSSPTRARNVTRGLCRSGDGSATESSSSRPRSAGPRDRASPPTPPNRVSAALGLGCSGFGRRKGQHRRERLASRDSPGAAEVFGGGGSGAGFARRSGCWSVGVGAEAGAGSGVGGRRKRRRQFRRRRHLRRGLERRAVPKELRRAGGLVVETPRSGPLPLWGSRPAPRSAGPNPLKERFRWGRAVPESRPGPGSRAEPDSTVRQAAFQAQTRATAQGRRCGRLLGQRRDRRSPPLQPEQVVKACQRPAAAP